MLKENGQMQDSDAAMYDDDGQAPSSDHQANASMKSKSTMRSGRRPIPIRWTRVVDVEEPLLDEMPAFTIEEDLDLEYNAPPRLKKKGKADWKPIFEPNSFWKSLEDHDLDSNKLARRDLKGLGMKVSELRRSFVEKAEEELTKHAPAGIENGEEVRKAAQKIRNRGSGKPAAADEIKPYEYMETVPFNQRKKCRTRNKLKLADRIKIAHQVLCQGIALKSVAKEHRISQPWVSSIVQKVRRKPELFEELNAAEEKRRKKTE